MLSLMTATLQLAQTPLPQGEGQERTYTFIASTGQKDNNGNIYDIAGWDLKTYLSNPVVLSSHQWTEPPIGAARRVWIEGDRLMAQVALADTPKAQEIRALLDQGFIRAMSVGCLTRQADLIRDEKTGWPTGIHSHRQQMVELSIVTIPGNPDTLRIAALGDNPHDAQAIIEALNPLKESLWTPQS